MSDFLKNFLYFWLKQANACFFWILLIVWMVATHYYYPIDIITKYDFLFLYAFAIQWFLLYFKLESWEEAKLIMLFHIVATAMEVFKTSVGSWNYNWEWIFMIWSVPMFAWFMYSAVWSYLMRVWRLFDFKFSNFPKLPYLYLLITLIYLNFFTHHYIWDFRYLYFTVALILFWKSSIYFQVNKRYLHMPLLVWFFLVAIFIWFAENISTYLQVWTYPNQLETWQMVSYDKILAWFLLMLVSFSLVTFVQKVDIYNHKTIKWK